jgi:hypothetical protein
MSMIITADGLGILRTWATHTRPPRPGFHCAVQLPQEKLIIPKSDQYLGLGTALNSETIKGGWWPSRTNPDEATSPLFLEEKPDLFGLEDVFNECNQAVALEDDVWEIATVSVLCSVHALYVVPT